MTWLNPLTWFRRTGTPPVAVAPAIPTPRPGPASISPGALASAAYGRKVKRADEPLPSLSPYRLPERPPGTSEAAMAMDGEVQDLWGWADTSGLWAEGLAFPGYAYLSELTQRPEYRRPSEILAKEMTRRWIKLRSTGQDDSDEKQAKLNTLEAAMKAAGIQSLFRRAIQHDGFFGRGQIFIDVNGSWNKPDEVNKPLADDVKVVKGTKLRFVLIEPIWSYPGTYNASDPLDPTFFKPQDWYVLARRVHTTRLLTFVSRELPDLLKPAYAFGGMSLSQLAKPYVDNWIRTRQSVSDLVHAFSVMVLATDLSSILQNGGEAYFNMRAELFVKSRDNRGVMMVDKETEELSNIAVPLGTLDALQAQSQEQQASVTGIPLVVLLGITPTGLNTTAEPEIRTFYAWISSQQEQLLTHPLSRVIELLQLSLFGEVDPDIGFEFVPLWQLDEKAQADLRKVDMDTDAVAIEVGVLDPHESRVRIASSPGSPYASLSLDPADDPEPPEQDQEMEGALSGAMKDGAETREAGTGGEAQDHELEAA